MALRWLKDSHKDSGGMLARWFLLLSDFQFVVVHKPGVDIPVADALSRATATVFDGRDQSDPTTNDPHQLTTTPMTMLGSTALQRARDAW